MKRTAPLRQTTPLRRRVPDAAQDDLIEDICEWLARRGANLEAANCVIDPRSAEAKQADRVGAALVRTIADELRSGAWRSS